MMGKKLRLMSKASVRCNELPRTTRQPAGVLTESKKQGKYKGYDNGPYAIYGQVKRDGFPDTA